MKNHVSLCVSRKVILGKLGYTNNSISKNAVMPNLKGYTDIFWVVAPSPLSPDFNL